MRYTVTQFARESVGLCPFRGSSVGKFELSHLIPVNRIIKITAAHNLHVVLNFVAFTIRTYRSTLSYASLLISKHKIRFHNYNNS